MSLISKLTSKEFKNLIYSFDGKSNSKEKSINQSEFNNC